MSFSYNESLVLENNMTIENLLLQMNKTNVLNSVKELVLQLVTVESIKKEFEIFNGMVAFGEITGEHIKNYFVIGLDGIERVWRKLTTECQSLHHYQSVPLYENVFTYFESLIDEMNFDTLFQKELTTINQK